MVAEYLIKCMICMDVCIWQIISHKLQCFLIKHSYLRSCISLFAVMIRQCYNNQSLFLCFWISYFISHFNIWHKFIWFYAFINQMKALAEPLYSDWKMGQSKLVLFFDCQLHWTLQLFSFVTFLVKSRWTNFLLLSLIDKITYERRSRVNIVI